MASLMENLIEILNKESEGYEGLLETSRKKTEVIIKGDLEALSLLTEEEQAKTNVISNLDKKREEVMKDMANVLNMDVNTLKLTQLVEILSTRPEEQKALAAAIERIRNAAESSSNVCAGTIQKFFRLTADRMGRTGVAESLCHGVKCSFCRLWTNLCGRRIIKIMHVKSPFLWSSRCIIIMISNIIKVIKQT